MERLINNKKNIILNHLQKNISNTIKTINIAFCFDKNYYRQAVVAILSLLYSAKKSTKNIEYNFYFLINNDVDNNIQNEINTILYKTYEQLKIKYIQVDEYFKDSYECRGISNACYYRLLLHKFLPELSKIIYSDVDVIFNTDLSEFSDVISDKYYFGANRDIIYNTLKGRNRVLEKYYYWNTDLKNVKSNYVNSGFLLLNLAKIRALNFDKKLIELTKNNYNFQDQDVLNILFIDKQDKIMYISPQYAVLVGSIYNEDYPLALKEHIISEQDFINIKKEPKIYHFAGIKPWDNSFHGSEIWWNFVNKNTPYYKYFINRYRNLNNIPTIIQKIFSIKNIKDKKVIRILGIKICFKRQLKYKINK